MSSKLFVTGVFVLALAGCGGGGGSDSGGQETSATESTAAPLAAQVSDTSLTEESPSSVEIAISPVVVDLENRLVFLPSTGWLSEDAFWDIYFNEPQKLPDNIDFDEIHKLGYREQSADVASGDNS